MVILPLYNLKWCCEGYVWRVFLRYSYAATSVCNSPQMYHGHILCTSTMNEIPILYIKLLCFAFQTLKELFTYVSTSWHLNMLQVLLLNLPESTNIRMEICVKPGPSKTCLVLGTLGSGFGFGLDSGTCSNRKVAESATLENMGVSENRGSPKSSILIVFSIINHPSWRIPIFWKHPYVLVCFFSGLWA